MTEAYILISTKTGEMGMVLEELKELDMIQEANMFTGPYDIITIAEDELVGKITNVLVEEIHQIPGVKDTTTCIKINQ